MPYVAYIQYPREREVIVGTLTDLKNQGRKSFDATFITIDELYTSLQEFREQEWIITCISELPELKERWHDKWTRSSPSLVTASSTSRENQV
ncbi:hypothetical protein [Marinococcus halotolerans]|uniref:hypothetical protein n=1 Tax=Marinococcus halotolerans TaxID=301092 RepID=UPI0003B5F6EA|nr:hypothetical protein [Marinococcus halotolerans]